MAEQTEFAKQGFVHSVYFWLKEPESETARQEFTAHLTQFLDNSLYVKGRYIGAVSKSDRDVVDSSYTFTLVVTFGDQAEQELYQDEPAHLKFVADAQHLWSKVVVYDSTSLS